MSKKFELIALAGPIGSGKTEIARTIQKLVPNTFVVSFAMPVKRIARECFGWNGEKDARGRRLLQCIGTDCGRAYDEDIWARALMHELFTPKFETADLIIIDDTRFDNEACAVKLKNGFVIELEGRAAVSSDSVKGHVSEAGISRAYIDYYVDNTGPQLQTAMMILNITNIAGKYALRPWTEES